MFLLLFGATSLLAIILYVLGIMSYKVYEPGTVLFEPNTIHKQTEEAISIWKAVSKYKKVREGGEIFCFPDTFLPRQEENDIHNINNNQSDKPIINHQNQNRPDENENESEKNNILDQNFTRDIDEEP